MELVFMILKVLMNALNIQVKQGLQLMDISFPISIKLFPDVLRDFIKGKVGWPKRKMTNSISRKSKK